MVEESSKPPLPPVPDLSDHLRRVAVPRELDSKENRQRWALGDSDLDRGPYLIELNLQYDGGLPGAAKAFLDLHERVLEIAAPDVPKPIRISKSYYRCELNVREWRLLVATDEREADAKAAAPGTAGTADPMRHRCIYKLWPDFPVKATITRSTATIKADAAYRSFEAAGDGITWAVIDSGVAATHPHFGKGESHTLLHHSVKDLHRCFAPVLDGAGTRRLADPDFPADRSDRDQLVEEHRQWALRDDFGHGTHVAGIIAGSSIKEGPPVVVLLREDRLDESKADDDVTARIRVTRANRVAEREAQRFAGMARNCRLVSLRVLDEKGFGRSSDVIRALEYIRETINDNPKLLRIQGVNLSVGYEFDAEMFACGQSPVCSEVNRLVQAGVVVVTAAGNTGYGPVSAQQRSTKVGLSNTINDPGNAEHAITVGATHRESPHTYGVSYFSSKGPTGDGRLKPDVVAPGERIISCAAGQKLRKAIAELRRPGPSPPSAVDIDELEQDQETPLAGQGPRHACYVEDSGTSMAAPHVSGAIAAFLSVRREFIGKPLEVKRIFLESAMPLGREKYFEGHGMLDLMKALQSV